MFDKNLLTFSPGWDMNAKKVAAFTDVRELQRQSKAQARHFLKERRASQLPGVRKIEGERNGGE